jgi:hypothetical protein
VSHADLFSGTNIRLRPKAGFLMWSLWIAFIILVLIAVAFLAVKVVKQYELAVIIPFVDALNRVSLPKNRDGTWPHTP